MNPNMVPSNGTFKLSQTWNHVRVLFVLIIELGIAYIGLFVLYYS